MLNLFSTYINLLQPEQNNYLNFLLMNPDYFMPLLTCCVQIEVD